MDKAKHYHLLNYQGHEKSSLIIYSQKEWCSREGIIPRIPEKNVVYIGGAPLHTLTKGLPYHKI